VKKYNIEALFGNRSYGSYGIKRDSELKEKLELPFFLCSDYLLVEPEVVEQRKVFTPFYKLWKKQIFDTGEQDITRISSFEIEERQDISKFICQEKHPFFTLEF
jgi:deoxyribodipyrimidine photolyase